MILSISEKEFQVQWTEFLDKKKNMIMNDGYFTKVFYSTPNYTMNSIYILFPFQTNSSTIDITFYQLLSNIEKQILLAYARLTPEKTYKEILRLSDFLSQKYKFIDGDYCSLKNRNIGTTNYIKISGIWEDIDGNIGITFKLI